MTSKILTREGEYAIRLRQASMEEKAREPYNESLFVNGKTPLIARILNIKKIFASKKGNISMVMQESNMSELTGLDYDHRLKEEAERTGYNDIEVVAKEEQKSECIMIDACLYDENNMCLFCGKKHAPRQKA